MKKYSNRKYLKFANDRSSHACINVWPEYTHIIIEPYNVCLLKDQARFSQSWFYQCGLNLNRTTLLVRHFQRNEL